MPFLHFHADARYLLWKQSQCSRHAVLYVDRRHIGISTLLEIDIDTHLAGSRRLGGHVRHVLHTVDRLLDRHHDRFHNRIGIGAGV